MKGGITSGVVYPLTICKLATRHRLRNIGGTSAGAIAAVMAAAAEYRRQHDHETPAAGYQALATLPLDVSGRLATLFQAPHGDQRHLRGSARRMGPKGKRAAVLALVRQQIGWFLGGLLLVLAVTLRRPGGHDRFPDRGARMDTNPCRSGAAAGAGPGGRTVSAAIGFVLSALRVLPGTTSGSPTGRPTPTIRSSPR